MRLLRNLVISVLIYGVAGAPTSTQEKRPVKTPHLGNLSAAELEYIRDHLKKQGERFKHEYHLNREQSLLLKQDLKKIEEETRNEKVNNNVGSIPETNEKAGISDYLLDGDILVSKKDIEELDKEQANKEVLAGRRKRQAINTYRPYGSLWESPIHYKLSSNLTSAAVKDIRRAIAFWEANTCLSFEENPNGPHIIEFFAGDGCYSDIGRRKKGAQGLSLGVKNCNGAAVHEIAHALGLFHTQARHDRDKYVAIALENVETGEEHNFKKRTEIDNENFNLPYDYGSVMQYNMNLFSKNGKPTIVAYDETYEYTMGGLRPTFYDVLMMNKLYSCRDRCKNSNTRCYNKGYSDPKNCDVCKCPSGLGGKLCDKMPSGCGRQLEAKSKYQTYSNSEDEPDVLDPLYPEFKGCNYWIWAPEGKVVEVTFRLTGSHVCYPGCDQMGIELKTGANIGLTGVRVCCPGAAKTMTSAKPFVLIISYSREKEPTEFEIKYRYLDDQNLKPSSRKNPEGFPKADDDQNLKPSSRKNRRGPSETDDDQNLKPFSRKNRRGSSKTDDDQDLNPSSRKNRRGFPETDDNQNWKPSSRKNRRGFPETGDDE